MALRIGDKVVLTKDKEAYYSGYGNNPKVVIKAGTIGVVGAVDTPQVRKPIGRHANETFTCVDFVVPEVFRGDPRHGNNTWRCSVYKNEMRAL